MQETEVVNLFNDINIEDFDLEVCCICLEDMVDNIHTLNCNHRFHSNCIIETFRNGLTDCPLCRQKAPARNPYLYIGHLKFNLLKSYAKKKNANKNIVELFEKYNKMNESIKEHKAKTKTLRQEYAKFKKDYDNIITLKLKFERDVRDIKYTRRFGRGVGKIACTEKLNEILKEQKKFITENDSILKKQKKYIKDIASYYDKSVSGYTELYKMKTLIESIPIMPFKLKT